MTWSWVGSVGGSIVSGLVINALSDDGGGGGGGGGGGASPGAQQAAGAADPFAPQRPQYQLMLQQLMTNPNAFRQSAEAQAITKQGLDSTAARMAARGLSSSGAEQAALTQQATTAAGQNYTTQMANLMQLAGAGQGSPGTAGQLLGASAAGNQQGMDLLTGQIGQGMGQLVNGWINPQQPQLGGGVFQGGNVYNDSNPYQGSYTPDSGGVDLDFNYF